MISPILQMNLVTCSRPYSRKYWSLDLNQQLELLAILIFHKGKGITGEALNVRPQPWTFPPQVLLLLRGLQGCLMAPGLWSEPPSLPAAGMGASGSMRPFWWAGP